MENKFTASEMYTLIKDKWTDAETAEAVAEFCNKELEKIAKKSARQKEKAAQKRAEGDELQNVIKSLLTNEYQTAEQILAQIAVEDGAEPLTKGKIVAKMKNLVESNQAVKGDIKTEEGKRKAYRLPSEV